MRVIPILALIALQSDDDIPEIEQKVKAAVSQPDKVDIRRLSQELVDIDSEKSMQAMIRCIDYLRSSIDRLWFAGSIEQELGSISAKIEELNGMLSWPGQDVSFLKAEIKRLEQLKGERTSQLMQFQKIDWLRGTYKLFTDDVAKFKELKSINSLLSSLNSDIDWYSKAKLIPFAAKIQHKDTLPVMLSLLKKTRDPEIKVIVINELLEAKQTSLDVIKLIREVAKTDYWQVKSIAKTCFETLEPKESIEALVELLKDAEGRVKIDITKALQKITGEDKEGYDPWFKWFFDNKEAITNGTFKPKENSKPTTSYRAAFFGIPVESKNVLFIVDKSGSMSRKVSSYVADAEVAKKLSLEPPDKERMNITRFELKKILKQLPGGTRANVIFFDSNVVPAGESMLEINDLTRQKLFKSIDAIEPSGKTNLFDAVMYGLAHGMDQNGRLTKSAVDAIYILTDGIPEVGLKEPESIVWRVTLLNKMLRISINTVLINDKSKGTFMEASKLMKDLAEQNYGQYVEIAE